MLPPNWVMVLSGSCIFDASTGSVLEMGVFPAGIIA
jgi:hypothetical protein